jgi:hypothetical protein
LWRDSGIRHMPRVIKTVENTFGECAVRNYTINGDKVCC